MKHSYSYNYNRVQIKPLEEYEIEQMRVLRNSHRYCFVYSDIITKEAQKVWFQNYLQKPDDYVFSVYLNKKWIGTASIYNVSENKAEFGRLLIDNQSTNEKGLGLDTTIGVCSIAFEQLGITKILLQVYEDNIPAYKTYMKAGFKVTGNSFDNNKIKLIDMELCIDNQQP